MNVFSLRQEGMSSYIFLRLKISEKLWKLVFSLDKVKNNFAHIGGLKKFKNAN